MSEFEKLLQENLVPLQRYVKFKISNKHDAEDIIQEVCLTATVKFESIKNVSAFKAWLIGIAHNKCNDYYRQKAKNMDISLESLSESALSIGKFGITEQSIVRDTLDVIGDKEKQILYLYFFKNHSQEDIAKQLEIPIGTVKSRLHYAKEKFKQHYPHKETPKGETTMKKLPEYLPEYKIETSTEAPFSVKWEELMGWFLIPKLGEKMSWGMYYIPSRKCSHVYDMQVTGKAKVHGIEGVELTAREASYSDKNEVINRTFVAQLTDTHCRYLATLRNDGDVRNYITFLDGDEFMPNWGFGEDNCGNETNLSVKGDIKRIGNFVTSADKDFLLDIVGRYTVTISGKSYDTVCVMDIETYNCGVVSEQFLDKNGKTILWRRYNKNDWANKHYKKLWTEMLPENERLIINGEIYVHWYDCVTDYIF